MPLFEYQCGNCGTRFERLARIADADRPGPCPQCGHQDSKRQISSFGWVGSGRSSSADAGACAPAIGGG